MTSPDDRIAGAPISWGVCEVPGWGYQLPPDRVLAEMAAVGLAATELGPDGFLPAAPSAMASTLSRHRLQAIGGFTPLLLHDPGHDPVPDVAEVLRGYAATGSTTLVMSAVTGSDGYDTRPDLDERGWATLLANLDRLAALATEHGVRAVLHPHVGTMVENGDDVARVLDGSSVALCLDTGHLLIGGTDPAELARQAPQRIAHIHFKDVDTAKARRVQAGRLTYTDAVREGMYRPLGHGDVDVTAIVGHLRTSGYDGWYVLEQDTILTEEPRGRGAGGRRAHQRRAPADDPAAQRDGTGVTEVTASEPLRIGVLGAARIAGLAIVEPARVTGDRLVAVAARDPARAAAFAAEHGVERALDSYADVLADPEVEVVYNPLANSLHGPWNLAATAAGKHVLSEKPFASNAAEARAVRAAAVAAGVVVVEGFHYLYHPVTRRLHEIVGSGELGEIRRVETRVTMPAPPDSDPRWSLELAGGALMDLGCYALHAQRMLAPWAGGEPAVVSARAAERAGHPGVDERMDVELAFPGGATGRAYCDMADDERHRSCRVIGDRGEATAVNFVLPHDDDRVVVSTGSGERVETLGTRTSYTYQLEAFRAHLRDSAPLPVDLDDAVATAELIDEVYRAAGLAPRPAGPAVVPAG